MASAPMKARMRIEGLRTNHAVLIQRTTHVFDPRSRHPRVLLMDSAAGGLTSRARVFTQSLTKTTTHSAGKLRQGFVVREHCISQPRVISNCTGALIR